MATGEQFWATVSTLAKAVRDAAPDDGTIAVVTLETYDDRTFVPMVVQRSEPWLLIETGDPRKPDDLDARDVVFLRELDIRRVVIRRECGDAGFGFSVGKVGLEVA